MVYVKWEDDKLILAVLQRDVSQVEKLLNNKDVKARINSCLRPHRCTPLRCAVQVNCVDAVRLLLAHGAEVDKTDMINMKNQTPLFLAICSSKYECAEVLLSANANPDGDKYNISSPLEIAAEKGLEREVMLLLRYGANTESYQKNHNDYSGGSHPLLASIVYSSLGCYKTLLAAGAEPDQRKLKFPVPDVVVAEMLLIHAIARYHPLDEKGYAQLLVLFGGYVKLMGTPLTLCQLCRISIRREIGKRRLKFLKTLPLPKIIIDYLLYKDVIEKKFLLYQ